MQKKTVLAIVLLSLTVGALAYISHSPWAYSRFNNAASNIPLLEREASSVLARSRSEEYYRATLHKSVDSIVIIKHLRELYVYHDTALQKIYRIALGDAPVGHKHFKGDEKTPEGLYYINDKNPNSACHKNLGISYPNAADRTYAAQHGRSPGGDIKIHGIINGQGYIGKAHLLHDWTNGCAAVTDEEIDELYQHTPTGIPILILP
jgi:murein L,D-transpeptidase YafK